METIRSQTVKSIRGYITESADSFINSKFDSVLGIISSDSISTVNDTNIGHHLSFLKLIEEIRS